jgi:hypothetical protein
VLKGAEAAGDAGTPQHKRPGAAEAPGGSTHIKQEEADTVKATWRSITLAAVAAVILVAGTQAVSAAPPKQVLYGTTGRCTNDFPGGPCTETSTLVQLDPSTGALIKSIGPVGYTVNGLAWDARAQKLYASTAIGDVAFHGLITINITTGAGTPVNPAALNFGLAGNDSPIHSITIHSNGGMVGWYDEFPTGEVTDTFVTFNKTTGVATEFPDTGIDTSANGLSFDGAGILWNVDSPRRAGLGAPLTQTAYRLDPATGKPLATVSLAPPTMAALGDFNPATNLYYGLKFTPFDPAQKTTITVVNLGTGAVTTLGQTVDNLHTLAFVKKVK